jgi:preprotein translocase subunit SecG
MANLSRVAHGLHTLLFVFLFSSLALATVPSPAAESGQTAKETLPSATELEHIPKDRDPWALLTTDSPLITNQPQVGHSKDDPDLVERIEQGEVDQDFKQQVAAFSLFKFMGGSRLFFRAFPAALFLSLLSAKLLGFRRDASKSRAATLRRFTLSFAALFFIYWTFLSCLQVRWLFQKTPFAAEIQADAEPLEVNEPTSPCRLCQAGRSLAEWRTTAAGRSPGSTGTKRKRANGSLVHSAGIRRSHYGSRQVLGRLRSRKRGQVARSRLPDPSFPLHRKALSPGVRAAYPAWPRPAVGTSSVVDPSPATRHKLLGLRDLHLLHP